MPSGTAFAHALLVEADPAPGTLLASPPAEVSLIFSEPISPAGPGLTVTAPSGRRASLGPLRTVDRMLSVPLAASERGTYLARWEVIAQDTHPSRGQFTFSVGHSSPAPPGDDLRQDVGAVSPAGLLLQSLGRWLHFLGLALGFGTVAFQVMVRPAPDRRLDRLLLVGVGLLVLAEPVALAGQAASLELPPQDLVTSSFGRAPGLRLGGALLLWAAAGAVRQAARGRPALLVLGLGVTLSDGLAGHRVAGLPELATFLLLGLHEAAMAIWLGGLAAFLTVREGARRFAAVAVACAVLLAGSGALLALAHLRGLPDLAATAYGAVLALKVIAVAAALAIARLGRRRLEVAVMAGVLALAGLLVSLPPPR